MARTVNPEEYSRKRNEIIDAAQRLVYLKGYERMTMQDIQDDLGISKGAFYHYFESKPAVLEALIARGQPGLDQQLAEIAGDPDRSALQKLRAFFDTIDQLRTEQQAVVISLLHIWLADENAIVREKAQEAFVRRRGPLLDAIARQGVGEGVFTIGDPDRAGVVILSIARGMNDELVRLMLAYEQTGDPNAIAEQFVATGSAMAEAIERVLGAPFGTLNHATVEEVRAWMSVLRRGA